MDDGIETVQDPEAARRARVQARGVYVRSLLLAAAINAIIYIV